VTANVSVLRWWFEDKPARLVINDSLRVELALTTDHRFWKIRLSGTTIVVKNINVRIKKTLKTCFISDIKNMKKNISKNIFPYST